MKFITLCGNFKFKKRIFLTPFLFVFIPFIKADDHNFESWNKKQFENYPFDCVEDGATQEYTRCYAEKLNKYDWKLRKEFNDDKLWKEWRDVRGKVCYHYKNKHFGQGTIKPLITLSCEMRLNTEVKRLCLSGEDKQCG